MKIIEATTDTGVVASGKLLTVNRTTTSIMNGVYTKINLAATQATRVQRRHIIIRVIRTIMPQ